MIARMRWLLLLSFAACLAACSSGFAPSSIDVDQARLEQAIATRFPYQTRWLGVLDVRAAAPTIRLLPEVNRVAIDVELTIDERLSARQLRGALAFQSGLRFEPGDNSLRFSQVSVDRIAVAGLPEALAGQTGPLGSVLAEQLLEGALIYRLSDAQQEVLRRERVQPGEIRVTSRGLNIKLEPRAAP